MWWCSMSKFKILIVEDEILSAYELQTLLERNGYSVVDICSRGQEAIKSAIHHKPDLIFMDIMLKDNISGSEAALKISTLLQTKIIFLTSHCNDEMLEYAVDANATSYLLKPFNTQQILAAVKLALKESMFTEEKSTIELKYNFIFDTKESKLFRYGSEIFLQNKTQTLFEELIKNIDRAVTYKQLIRAIYKKDANTTALRTLISRFNNKINAPLIENISGIGYKISSKKY